MKTYTHEVGMKAAFGAGCFWHVEDEFRRVKGVRDVAVGYMGGHTESPTYEDVSSGASGHVEVVQVDYDPQAVPYGTLLNLFFSIHDPTSIDQQGPDIGSQYRSAIFYYSSFQRREAKGMILDLSRKMRRPVVTILKKAKEFYPAEDRHQHFLARQRGVGVA